MNPSKPETSTDANDNGLAKEDENKNGEEARKRKEEAQERVSSMIKSIVAEHWALLEMKHEAFLLKTPPAGMNLPGWKKKNVVFDRNFWNLEECHRYHDGVDKAIQTACDKLEGQEHQILDEMIRRADKDKAERKEREEVNRANMEEARRFRELKRNSRSKEQWSAHRAEEQRIADERRAAYRLAEQERRKRANLEPDEMTRVEAEIKREAAQLVLRMKERGLSANPAYSPSSAKPVELKGPEGPKPTGQEGSQSKTQDERQRHFWEAGAREEAGSSSSRLRSSRQGSPADTADMADLDYVRVDMLMLDLGQSEEFEGDDDEMYGAD
ncbi:hypothetical protein F5X68DRAFT_251816 [Plectosphaerella plurivora]|uniref:Uncharacterized protein n=1 Tax=Plectosphaerella plurivora TaxID=936078 RepID=A0A9P8V1K7_9PEZI|nr:hypothetical protein F5X68DRAFT_251816 [Plectosphaerella plurivora]